MWQDAQLGFTVGARENGRRQSSPKPGATARETGTPKMSKAN